MDLLTSVTAITLIVAVYCAYFSVAVKAYRDIQSVDDFFIYNRRLREIGVFSALYSAEMSLATVFIAFMTLAPIMGLSLLWSIVTFSAGQFALFLTIPSIKKHVDSGQTLQTFLGAAFRSPALRRIASITSVLGFIGLFATEVIVGTRIFQTVVGRDSVYLAALLFVSFLVVFYTTLGGFRAVVTTDKLQSIGIIFATVLLVAVALTIGGDADGHLFPPNLLDQVWLPGLMLFNFALINIAYPLVDMSAWQRIAAARNVTVARRGFGLGVVMFLLSWSAILFAALSLTEYTRGDPAGGLVEVFGAYAQLNIFYALLAGIAVAALAAAMLSTGDTFLIAAAQSLCMDIVFGDFFDRRRSLGFYGDGDAEGSLTTAERVKLQEQDRAAILFSRRAIFCMAGAGILICLVLQKVGFGVADFVFVVYGSTVALFPVVLYALFFGRQGHRTGLGIVAICSVIAGIGAGWFYGIVAVVIAGERDTMAWLSTAIDFFPGGPSAYNAPTVAFSIAASIFIAGGLVTFLYSVIAGNR